MSLAVPTPAADPRVEHGLARLRWALADGVVVARRNLTHVRHVPEKLIDVTVQPLMFVILFAYVFGGAIPLPAGGDYHEYLVAGICVQTLAFSGASTAVSVAADMQEGVIDRFRALPMARSAVLLGRTVADAAASVIGLVVMVGAGLIVGWSIHDGVLEAAAAFALLLLFSYAMSWVGTLLGLIVRTADAAQGMMFVTIFPLTFVANTYVPTGNMPAFVRTLSEWNPLSAVVAATRELFGNPNAIAHDAAWPLQHPVPVAFAWCFALLTICVPLAVRRYRSAIGS